jgi:hypothetical protein
MNIPYDGSRNPIKKIAVPKRSEGNNPPPEAVHVTLTRYEVTEGQTLCRATNE